MYFIGREIHKILVNDGSIFLLRSYELQQYDLNGTLLNKWFLNLGDNIERTLTDLIILDGHFYISTSVDIIVIK